MNIKLKKLQLYKQNKNNLVRIKFKRNRNWKKNFFKYIIAVFLIHLKIKCSFQPKLLPAPHLSIQLWTEHTFLNLMISQPSQHTAWGSAEISEERCRPNQWQWEELPANVYKSVEIYCTPCTALSEEVNWSHTDCVSVIITQRCTPHFLSVPDWQNCYWDSQHSWSESSIFRHYHVSCLKVTTFTADIISVPLS